MIQGGKEIYFSKEWSEKMVFGYRGADHQASPQMSLWTVLDGNIYLEESPFKDASINTYGIHTNWLHAHIKFAMATKGFPKDKPF